MTEGALVSRREELRAIALMGRQPRSSRALGELIARVQTRVVQAALKDPQVARRLHGVRYRVVGADLREHKDEAASATPARLAEIGVYDYDRNVLVVPVVDLRRGRVVAVEERSGLQPPLTAEELEEARRIVFADRAGRAFRRQRRLAVVALPARVAFLESHPRYGHRCFALYLWTGATRPRRLAAVMVDLSTREVVPGDPDDPALLDTTRR